METDNTPSDKNVIFRKPSLQDGYAIYSLIQNSPPLDLNSSYLYFLQADHFSDTCVVAENQGQIVGFISAYFNPKASGNLFVWQVAVDTSMRGKRLALRLLEHLVCNQLEKPGFDRISATISPSNIASQKLFKRFAETHGLSVEKQSYLETQHFGDLGHEAEELYTLKSPDNQLFKSILFKH
ncbi:diaminobutyrate acetyltransferase [Thiomicrorhabdus sp.]|uniref:diaminobutyrate acetyltransferase n=1 Tax=Thiomicrorhabdus sp. TaxID=2039724 RepID=UPI00356AA509